ncbi:MAG: type I restriction enzyme HsdR N-terminal domain-containing protein, partial [Desulfobacteraceae bacterium]|nr:type I restriction enzyme HsdR N-terminal domain-containing protein [Desulfobacteraceae bacterium]
MQTKECVATDVAPITAVWVKHGREQLNVCNSCLEEKVDLAVFDKNNNPIIVVDIKNKTGTSEDWAANIYDKLVSYNLIPKAPFFLIILPDKAYLWKQENAGQNSQLNGHLSFIGLQFGVPPS